MMNLRLIEETIKLVNEFYAAENIYENNSTLKKSIIEWYCNTDITDVEMLAAVTMYGRFRAGLTWDDLLEIKEYFFPTVPIEYSNYGIGEIEEALLDAFWR